MIARFIRQHGLVYSWPELDVLLRRFLWIEVLAKKWKYCWDDAIAYAAAFETWDLTSALEQTSVTDTIAESTVSDYGQIWRLGNAVDCTH